MPLRFRRQRPLARRIGGAAWRCIKTLLIVFVALGPAPPPPPLPKREVTDVLAERGEEREET